MSGSGRRYADADAVIVDAVRTPRGRGSARGALASLRPVELVGALGPALLARAGLGPDDVDDLILGVVGQVGDQGADLARIAALWMGWTATPGQTVNRFCCSGLDALVGAAARVRAQPGVIVAGGVESLSRVPMFADAGAWFADPDVAARTGYVHMAVAADLVASRHGVDRAAIDACALASHQRALAARERGAARSLVPVVVDGRVVLGQDELARADLTAEALAALPALQGGDDPAFAAGRATVQARFPEVALAARHSRATAPALADGAALAVLADGATARGRGLPVRARVRGWASVAVDPVEMLTGNVPAITRALAAAGLTMAEVDAIELNESFAAVVVHAVRALGLAEDRVNADGGAIALGHPLGATGGVLLSTLLDRLERTGGAIGVASICGGAGVATALVVERC
ncbi:MAG: acetyl-CoA C-acyltransferase [Kofleriaceae bacterium]|nr:acetyl-CoA C-acyltransferase [Kofleriaceae bacterium]